MSDSKSSFIRSWMPARSLGAVVSFMLLLGCDFAFRDATPADAPMLDHSTKASARLDVCHVDGQEDPTIISAADAAYSTHVARGDGGIGDVVPGMENHVFDEACELAAAVVWSAQASMPKVFDCLFLLRSQMMRTEPSVQSHFATGSLEIWLERITTVTATAALIVVMTLHNTSKEEADICRRLSHNLASS